MTVEEMCHEVERAFSSTVQAQGGRYNVPIPSEVTPLSWQEVIKPDTDLTARGEGMAMAGLYYGCDRFARLTILDRAEAKVKGHMKVHKRERALIVRALGWKGTK